MASTPPPVSQPAPLKCSESPAPALHHPVPDLQSLQGAYISNIERLEDRAERMSEAGSDLGEEIRRLQLEQKITEGRLESLRSAAFSDDVGKPFTSRSRGASTSSYGKANSIVDVNTTARWGGYSPTGYVTSPVGSLHSVSRQSAAAVPLQRQRSGSKTSRLGQVVHADETVEEPTSPKSHKSSNTRPLSVSSFTRQFDETTQQILEGSASRQPQDNMNPQTHDQSPLEQPPQPWLDAPDRPPTSLSTDTARQAGLLWDDFDGVHCPDAVPEERAPTMMSPNNRRSRASTLMRSPPHLPPGVPPPPGEGMVFYPAPVPSMLNLPKRLSKMPVAEVQARRRTQLLDAMQSENRKSAPWLAEKGPDADIKQARKSRQSLANLPPQLRASAYFDRPAPVQEFEVKGESAEETLESILEASTMAPVSAFTDHPYAGHIGSEVYGSASHGRSGSKTDARKSKSTLDLLSDKTDARKSRSSLNLLDTRRNSSGDPLNKLKKRNSSADLGVLTVRATESRMSLGDELDEPDNNARGPELGGDITPTRRSVDDDQEVHPHDAVDEEELLPEEQYFGPPTTLLAELQMRKQQQKSRNLTAATAFPNGMHATLLQLDAVAEVEKKKRQGQKVNLAWEAEPKAPDEDDSEDDVPIGILFPGTEGLVKKAGAPGAGQPADWDRPLGLIEKRQLEDNEPLSQRRTRLFGLDPNRKKTQMPLGSQSQPFLAVPGSAVQPESDEEGEGETLAERQRRLKEKKALDAALGDDVRKSTISGDFAIEMLGQFGVKDNDDKSKPAATPGADGDDEEEETLGQRRARLQAEALARGDANPLGTRPPLRGSMSLANILTANPLDNTNTVRKVSDEQLVTALPQGSLLRQNAEAKARLEADKADRHRYTSTFGPPLQPLVANQQKAPEQAVAARIQAYKDQMAGVGVIPSPAASTPRAPSMMFNPMVGMTPMSNPGLPGSRGSYFPSATMGMPAPPAFGMPGMGGMGMTPGSAHGATPQQMMAMNMSMMSLPGAAVGMQNMPAAFQHPQLGGGSMRQSSMVNLPMGVGMGQMGPMGPMGMNMGVGMMEPPMETRQRDMIDRWRNNVF